MRQTSPDTCGFTETWLAGSAGLHCLQVSNGGHWAHGDGTGYFCQPTLATPRRVLPVDCMYMGTELIASIGLSWLQLQSISTLSLLAHIVILVQTFVLS